MIPFLQPLIAALLAQTPGEAQAAWPNGPSPSGARASVQRPVADYIDLVRTVETALPALETKSIIRRIRRMHYSKFSVKPESKTSQSIDETLDDTSDNPDDKPPLTTDDVPQDVLDELYSTGSVITEAGLVVDITHVLNLVDLAANGRSAYAIAALVGTTLLPGSEVADLDVIEPSLGWLGDLSTVWFEWMNGREPPRSAPVSLTGAERTRFEAGFATRCPVDDLLGDIDGAVLAASPDLLGQPLSETLRRYYADEASPASLNATQATSRQRFHYFVARAVPAFRHAVTSPAPLRVTVDAANATAIRDLEKRLVRLIWDQYANVIKDQADSHDPIFLELANRFLKWLQDGLADRNGGVPAWPPDQTAVPR